MQLEWQWAIDYDDVKLRAVAKPDPSGVYFAAQWYEITPGANPLPGTHVSFFDKDADEFEQILAEDISFNDALNCANYHHKRNRGLKQ